MSPPTGPGRYWHREVSTMAASIIIEQESGTYSGRTHPHNGYYAGDFSAQRRSSRPTPLVSRTS